MQCPSSRQGTGSRPKCRWRWRDRRRTRARAQRLLAPGHAAGDGDLVERVHRLFTFALSTPEPSAFTRTLTLSSTTRFRGNNDLHSRKPPRTTQSAEAIGLLHAPSLTPEAFPAATEPSGRTTPFSFRRRVQRRLARMLIAIDHDGIAFSRGIVTETASVSLTRANSNRRSPDAAERRREPSALGRASTRASIGPSVRASLALGRSHPEVLESHPVRRCTSTTCRARCALDRDRAAPAVLSCDRASACMRT